MADEFVNANADKEEENIYLRLTHDTLDAKSIMDQVRSPSCGAIVLFAGTTRDNFQGKPVKHLAYSSYESLAIRTMRQIALQVKTKHQLHGIAIVHRLGMVPIGEESILIAVSSPHRQAAWAAGEETLERVKDRVEIWKLEEFGGEDGGVWRANRDGQAGIKVADKDLSTFQATSRQSE
ncbi:Molybdopterin biosynthesis MoaE [Myriangium duriaei CBS 260.36]|uniref:Molybdopterin synthase catalytic subunit n=1 Tax=Myriangium duriaei CBS 260.36 TaxID=1168546 RepID=A0A9P4IUT1_9PEZI|nr:Molybdopterin biosynthesis MoaE [Myriangium duriaei CBS 260.36]